MSVGETGDTGGVAFIMRRKLLGEATQIRMQTLVEGRVSILRVSAGDALLEVAGIHNYGLTISQANLVANELQSRTRAAQAALMQRCLCVVGDWNFDAPGESPMVIGETAERQAGPQRPRLGAASLRRSLAFLRVVPAATHPCRVWAAVSVVAHRPDLHVGAGLASHADGVGGEDHE